MGINAHTDTFKFTAPIFPNIVYTWNPEEMVVIWQKDVATEEEILEAFNVTGLPVELFEAFSYYVQNSANRANCAKPNIHDSIFLTPTLIECKI